MLMPSVTKKFGEREITVYFNNEKDREKYVEDYTPVPTDLHGSYDRRRQKAYRLQGDRDALKVYSDAYSRGKWFGSYSPNQIKQIYKEAL